MDPINSCLVLIYDSAYSRSALDRCGDLFSDRYREPSCWSVGSVLSFSPGSEDYKDRLPATLISD